MVPHVAKHGPLVSELPDRPGVRLRLRATLMRGLRHAWIASPFARPPLDEQIDKAVWYSRFARWRDANPCPVSPTRWEVYENVARAAQLDRAPITYLEFGTFEGESLRWWLSFNRNEHSRFVGFDSFEGLSEPWRGYDVGHFATQPPRIDDPRCRLVTGLFQKTLPGFLTTHRPHGTQVVFMDADLYSSTLFVLAHIAPHLRPGDLITFDEFQVWMHEFRAFVSVLSAFPMEYQLLRRSPDWSQVVLEIR